MHFLDANYHLRAHAKGGTVPCAPRHAPRVKVVRTAPLEERSRRGRLPRCPSPMRTLPPRRRLFVPSVRFLLLSLLLLLAHAPSPSHAAPFRYFCSKDSYDKKTMTTGPLALWETMKHEIDTYLSNQSIHNLTAKGDRAEREICMYVRVMEEGR